MDSVSDIEKLNTATTDLLLTASYETIQTKNFNSKWRPYWTSEVRETHKAARDKRKLWINEGMPRRIQHESFRNYKAAKRLFTNT